MLPGIPVHLRAEKPELLLGHSVGARLKRRRLELGLKQVEVAERLRVSEFTVLGWEVRGREPGDRHYPAIIAFLGNEPWPEPQTLGERLRAERLRRGLSKREAARIIGTDEECVRMWETGAWKPTSRTIPKLSGFLGLAISRRPGVL